MVLPTLADAVHDVTEAEVSLRDKVRFLQRPDSYPERPRAIEVKESHMSWVFLTEERAYKLKKPVRYSYLDYSTLAARAENCAAEVRLNRRFAPDVYLGIVPLNLAPSGQLRLGGAGLTCDWLVKMVRLPAERTLEAQIGRDQVDEAQLRQAVHVLTRVYREAAPVDMTAAAYRLRFRNDIRENLAELTDPAFELSSDLPQLVAAAQRRFLDADAALLNARVEGSRIVEGHGDLRPEHIYLGDPPIIMDCLEFNRELRLLDPVDELAYLAIECHRLGAPHLGDVVLATYRADTGDRPPARLVDFYASLRAMLRAKLAIWHLRDEQRSDAEGWRARTMRYLYIAADHAAKLDRADGVRPRPVP
jgi:aminoglycoside phosphotransferase family enzyme